MAERRGSKRLTVTVATAIIVSAMLRGAAPANGDTPAIPLEPVIDQSVISDHALSNVQGAIGLNQAAGNGNAQANVLAIGASGAPRIGVSQQPCGWSGIAGRVAIEANAFTNAVGAIRVNQVAGDGNAQANVIAIFADASVDVLSDMTLAAAVIQSKQPSANAPAPARQQISVSSAAFNGARGIVQLDQTAGSGNSATNDLTIRIGIGAKP